MAGKKTSAVARASAPMSRALAAIEKIEQRTVQKLDLLSQRFEVVERAAADYDRVDQKLDRLREVFASAGGMTDQREELFVRRLRAMEAYARGDDGPDGEWVERDMSDSSAPRGALQVAAAFSINRELIEQLYGQYQLAYEGAHRRWLEKYPDGVRDKARCFACGQLRVGTKPCPLPRMEARA